MILIPLPVKQLSQAKHLSLRHTCKRPNRTSYVKRKREIIMISVILVSTPVKGTTGRDGSIVDETE
jgi:hypothetical protein